LKKPSQKVAYLWQFGGFFSAAPTAQNSQDLHFRFINSYIKPSLVGSLTAVQWFDQFYAQKETLCQTWVAQKPVVLKGYPVRIYACAYK
jgi:hypothetical protein